MTTKTRTVKFCSLGLGGNSMEYGEGCVGSWYAKSPEEIAEHYAEALSPGVLLLDKRPALERQAMYAYASPMVNVDMAAEDVDRFGSRYMARGDDTPAIMLDAMKETGFGPIIQAAEVAAEVAPDVPGPLDYVPVGQFVEWWTSRGAVLYRYDGQAFQAVE